MLLHTWWRLKPENQKDQVLIIRDLTGQCPTVDSNGSRYWKIRIIFVMTHNIILYCLHTPCNDGPPKYLVPSMSLIPALPNSGLCAYDEHMHVHPISVTASSRTSWRTHKMKKIVLVFICKCCVIRLSKMMFSTNYNHIQDKIHAQRLPIAARRSDFKFFIIKCCSSKSCFSCCLSCASCFQ